MQVIVEIIEQTNGDVAVGVKTNGLASPHSSARECRYAIAIRDHIRGAIPELSKQLGGKECFPITNPKTERN